MVTDDYQNDLGDQFIMYTNVESLYCTPKTDMCVKYHINNFCVFITYFNDTGYIRLHKYIIKVNLIFFTFINVAIRELKLQSGLPSSLGHAHLLSLEFPVLVLLQLFF